MPSASYVTNLINTGIAMGGGARLLPADSVAVENSAW